MYILYHAPNVSVAKRALDFPRGVFVERAGCQGLSSLASRKWNSQCSPSGVKPDGMILSSISRLKSVFHSGVGGGNVVNGGCASMISSWLLCYSQQTKRAVISVIKFRNIHNKPVITP